MHISYVEEISIACRRSDLWDWGPVGKLIEVLRSAMRGDDGFTKKQKEKLETWADRWDELSETLKPFYVYYMNKDDTVSVALYYILENKNLNGWQHSVLKKRWVEKYGYLPPYDIFPEIR